MSNASNSKKPFRFTGFHMALCMVVFFGVIIAVNIFMATLASTSWTGLVVKNSYVASQKFNGELAAAKVQQAKGWVSKLTYENGILQFDLSDQNGGRLNISNMNLFIGRPAFEQQDKTLKFSSTEQGPNTIPLQLAEGPWQLKITGTVDGAPYRRDAKLIVDASGSGKIQ